MREHIENGQYNTLLRLLLWRYHKIKNIRDKDEWRNLYNNYADAINGARRQLQEIGKAPDRIVVTPDPNYPEYYTIIYKTPFEFDGTKDEFAEYLWENKASYCAPSQYDCTGQHFTTGFKIAKVGDNLWRVAESMGVDV